MMEKTFDPATVEADISRLWAEEGAFEAGKVHGKPVDAGQGAADPFTIVIPPPNVTGALHMGHALNNTLQDILCRFERMCGKDVLWQPGTDHAGIATQMVVERQMMERQEPGRREIGRKAFLEKVWVWKAESGGTIINQLKRLGASCDWGRERFTMGQREDGEAGQMQRAVAEFFVSLHEARTSDGKPLLYRDKRLVNWDPNFQTAISDLEVEQIEKRGSFAWARGQVDKEGNPVDFDAAALGKLLAREPHGHLYYFDYPIVDAAGTETGETVTVATTRPETMLGDTGVAIHPGNPALAHLIGKIARLPLVGRLIPIVGDDYADPEKGTGAVKITPAHDFNDFELGKRHGLAAKNIFTGLATLYVGKSLSRPINPDFADTHANPDSPESQFLDAVDNLDRYDARLQVVEAMHAEARLAKVEPTMHAVPHGDRSGVAIEPWLTEQWYVDVKPLAEKAMAAVRAGKTKILPANREADFFRWLENIQPWCISRQLWWGHQVPVWYGPNGEVIAAHDEAEAKQIARTQHGDIPLQRDEDVLDTWFSSALWPFSTLGWPDKTPELARYYPTSVLVTGFDILFFWVARMMMAGLFTQGEVPFHTVYLHGLVRDEKGRKMSKTLGNVIDPLTVIDQYGADALRFTLASLAAQGRDPKLGVKTAEGYRNFCTKLWNAARFAEINGCMRRADFDPRGATTALNRWILSESAKAAAEIVAGITQFRFNDAAGAAYRFVWNTFCDWYLELAKPALQGEAGAEQDETRATTAFVLDQIVKLLHPFMPFITESLWAAFAERAGRPNESLLCHAPWPALDGLGDGAAEREIGFIVELIAAVRSVRSEMNVPVASLAPIVLVNPDAGSAAIAHRWAGAIRRLARAAAIETATAPPAQSAQMVVHGTVACLPLAGLIDFNAERARLARERDKLAKDIEATMRKLDNADFVARAPEEVVEENRERVADARARVARIEEALARLG